MPLIEFQADTRPGSRIQKKILLNLLKKQWRMEEENHGQGSCLSLFIKGMTS